MVLQRTEPTEEQTNNEIARTGELHKSISDTLKDTNVMGDVLKDLGLSPESEEKKEEKPAVKSQPEPDEEPEEETSEENSENEEEQEEEVIPKSKVQKRFDELTARLKAQEKELEQLKASKAEPKDEVTRQLESMTTEQLKAAKLEVRKAQIKSQDDAQLNELIALEDKINSQLENAPKNFANAQKEAYVKKAEQLAISGEIPDVEKNAPAIMKLANDLYQEYPMLQKDVNGQAIALELAVKHFKAVNSVPGDKTKESELKRQVNNLKRKTTLDTKTGKSNSEKSHLDTLKRSAMGGSMQNKVNLVRSHPMFNVDKMIPDEFKQ